ncbi:MAG TPA: FkbM family methyltransferase [Kiritimatiellia bacterium]|nr:FkbM family methyltransferase [Kiritimatiellia bacterium]HMO98696.1 FkbM family methyltransferase [Kiritimatiellia bacterium]HMP90883.1 FkbM family methyltransferase [Kiritimatiellia bacterium]
MKTLIKSLLARPLVGRVVARVLRPLYRLASWLVRTIPWAVKVTGCRLKVDGQLLVFPEKTGVMYSTLLYWLGPGGYEYNTWQVIRWAVSRSSSFLDVGSNIGLYAVLAGRTFPTLVVDAFEPVPSLAEGNRRFHEANGFPSDRVHACAMSDAPGRARISVPRYEGVAEAEPTASLADNRHLSPGARFEEIEVALETIDGFLAANPRANPLFIKIDVEGHEISVLRGAHATLRERRPLLVVEMLPNPAKNREVFDEAEAMGYRLFGLCREGLFAMNAGDFSPPRTFTDFLFVPREVCGPVHYLPYSELDRLVQATS